MAEKTKKKGEYNQEELYEMTDPIAYRSDYNPDDIINKDDPNIPWVWPQNANLNYNQYGDDSNPAWQWQLWWTNEKYTWEWVATSNLEYNPNVKTSDLDYKYWEAARQANAADAGYLARRNDNIASALYNEWKTTKEDVAYYLASQPDWNNSTEMDRANTIESIWKRIWELWPKEEQPTEEKTDTTQPVNEWNKIYWKATADTWEPTEWITTLNDANSIYNEQMQVRINNVKTLLSMPVSAIATELENGDIPWDMQSIIDYKEWYPDMWVQVEAERKKIRWQETVNAITSWEDIPSWTNGTSAANNEIANFAADNSDASNSMTDIMKDIHQTLDANKTAQWANETMADIEEEIATLNKRLKNLKEEANNIFKWDVPDYIVKAYINNRTQEIQDKLSILSERYKYASARYDKEVANAQWEKEYSLKERQVKVQEETLELNKQKNALWINTDVPTYNWNNTSTSLSGKELPMTNKSREEIWAVVDNLVTMLNNNELGNAQCATWVQTYYLPSLWISFWTLSDWGNKLWIRNEWKNYTPQKWDLIIMLWSKAKYWHMWIVVWITTEGKIQYLDWNGDKSWDEKPALREIDPDSIRIQGYYNATKWVTSTGSSNVGNTNDDWELIWWQFYEWQPFNVDYAADYEKFNSGNYTAVTRPEKTAEKLWLSMAQFREQATTYKRAKESWMLDVNDPLLREWGKWTWLNWKTYDFSSSPTYKKLSDKDKKWVMQLLDNQKNFSSMTTNRTDYDSPASILAAVKEIEPEWSETWYSNRQKAENKRATSEIWGYVSSNKTAMSRARAVYNLADTLEDQNRSKVSKLLKWNNIKTLKDLVNWKEEETWNPDVTRLKVAIDAFINEYAKALKWWNASNAVEDVMREQSIFSMGLSQEQLKVAMEEAARALYEKDVTEISDLKRWSYLKQDVTWLEEDADWLYNVVWIPLDKYYNYTPKWWINPYEDKNEETTTTTTSSKFSLSNLFHNSK